MSLPHLARRTLGTAALGLFLVTACQLPDQGMGWPYQVQPLTAPPQWSASSPAPVDASQPRMQQPTDPRSAMSAGSGAAGAGVPAGGQLDGSICGSWSRTESFGSGEYSGSTRHRLQVNPDGTFVLGAGEYAGLGGELSGGAPAATGRWCTARGVVYVTDGFSAWEAYARYGLVDGRLVFTFADESRQIWYRG